MSRRTEGSHQCTWSSGLDDVRFEMGVGRGGFPFSGTYSCLSEVSLKNASSLMYLPESITFHRITMAGRNTVLSKRRWEE